MKIAGSVDACPLTAEQIKSVKGQGFLHNKGTRNFSARVITENGILTEAQMAAITEAARRFGNGSIALTVRLTLEVQGIPFEQIPEMTQFMQAHGLSIGGTGPKVRPVVVCKGTTCSNGLCDTAALGTAIHKHFYEDYRQVTLPHKFKIAVGGCPNNCVKPDLNDIGIVAIRRSRLVDEEVQEARYRVYVGGRWGKKVRQGSLLSQTVSESEALDMIEKAILLFKKEGKPKERFADTIQRLGLEVVEAALYGPGLLEQKGEILEAQPAGSAQ